VVRRTLRAHTEMEKGWVENDCWQLAGLEVWCEEPRADSGENEKREGTRTGGGDRTANAKIIGGFS